MIGGTKNIIKKALIEMNKYNEFINLIEFEYSREFKNIQGEDLDYALPSSQID